MDYALAKQLKDAGFPQRQTVESALEQTSAGLVPVYHPILEELIEACGDKFAYLGKLGERWEATSEVDRQVHTTNAKTSTEAVARLWLALNKK